jgi:hypothetical protein
MELGEDFRAQTVQSLIDRRLIVRVGNKYDIYWDIFRDYLNGGKLPIQDNYIIRMQVGSVSKAVKHLVEAGSNLTAAVFMSQLGLTQHSFHNLSKDMKLLGFVRIRDGVVSLQVNPPSSGEEFESWFTAVLRDRLRRNRLVSRISEELSASEEMSLDHVGDLLAATNPYISATKQTWRDYARTIADWMDAAGFAAFDSRLGTISRSQSRARLRSRRVLPSRSRGMLAVPNIQYSPLEQIIVRLVEATSSGRQMDWSGLKRSTISKGMTALENLGFIHRSTQSIEILPQGREFAMNPDRRPHIFAESATQMVAFSTFLEVLSEHQVHGLSLAELGMHLRDRLGVDWKPSTGETNAKIMLDWARHSGLAPGAFSSSSRPSESIRERRKQIANGQLTFDLEASLM